MKKSILLLNVLLAIVIYSFVSCEKDDDKETENGNTFTSLESPYLICANRNPGGVGFDFEYNGETGGANNFDSLSVDDFEYDVKIRTIKGEKGDGSLSGAPFIQLYKDVKAVNYSAVDTTCTGITRFNALTSSNIESYTLSSDDASFDVSNLTTGNTGAPMMSALQTEYAKLVIGEKWKSAAKNSIEEDEPVWIIETREGQLVKFIVTDFPADPAPTTTGYIAITWDYLD
jgi:hypothetical protein